MTVTPDVQADNALQVEAFDVARIRREFPALAQSINGKPLVYLDNAATSQKPQQVIDALVDFYSRLNSNVHRGANTMSDRATEAFEAARTGMAEFINAGAAEEIVWTSGSTASINLVARSYGDAFVSAGDRILVSTMAHHSNIVPWQMLAERKGAEVVPIPVNDLGEIDQQRFHELLDGGARIVAFEHVSNALGTVNPVGEMVAKAHEAGAIAVVDGAQAIGHWPLDVKALDVDFYAFSGHKMYGPTGVGVLYGKQALLEAMPPLLGGGEMIESVSFEQTVYNRLPYKFEAGTPNIADVVGLHAAVKYLQSIDREGAERHEEALLTIAHALAAEFEGMQVVSRAAHSAGVLSFNLEGAHPADVGMLLDQQGVIVRTGNHCAQPIIDQLTRSGTVRASFAFYNTLEEIDMLFTALSKARLFLQ